MLEGISAQGYTSVVGWRRHVVHLASGPKCHIYIMRGCGVLTLANMVLGSWMLGTSGPLEISVNDLISSSSYFLLNLARMDFVIFN